VARRAQRQEAALKAVAAEYAAFRARKLDESRVVRPAREAPRLQDGVLLRPEPVAHYVLARLVCEADALGRVQEYLFLRPHRCGLHRESLLDPLVVWDEFLIAERELVRPVVCRTVVARVVSKSAWHGARRITEVV